LPKKKTVETKYKFLLLSYTVHKSIFLEISGIYPRASRALFTFLLSSLARKRKLVFFSLASFDNKKARQVPMVTERGGQGGSGLKFN